MQTQGDSTDDGILAGLVGLLAVGTLLLFTAITTNLMMTRRRRRNAVVKKLEGDEEADEEVGDLTLTVLSGEKSIEPNVDVVFSRWRTQDE